MKNKILLLLIVATLFSSCRKETPVVTNPKDETIFTSWSQIFESFWNGMNHSYSFWDIDPTDWDAVYKEYKPRFDNLELYKGEDSIRATELFGEMTANLIDHHYGLTLYDGDGKAFWGTRPGGNEVSKRDYYHERFSKEDLDKTINVNVAKGRITDLKYGESDMYTYSYDIDNGIAYIYLSDFLILTSQNNPNVMDVIENFFNIIKNKSGLKGIIIDTRGNGGGYLMDMNFIMSPLVDKEVVIAHCKTKNGMGRLDYNPWAPFVIYPDKEKSVGKYLSNIPIIALADINSVSMGEVVPIAIKALPQGYVIGERTFGGHGPLNGDFRYNYSGTFKNTAFSVYTSTSITKNIDGNIYEGIGITPDIEALYNEDEFLSGNDTQLERAIEYINTGK